MIPVLFIPLMLVLLPMNVEAQEHGGHAHQKSAYAGFQDRAIKSLSEEDIEELRRGGGWGMALPAELNGMPGPAHLLEFQEELGLSKEQILAIETIYTEMQAEAIEAGERFIAAEAELNAAFAAGDLDQQKLRHLVDVAASARADLRFIHLSRHLSTPPLLSEQQVRRYNILRGYADDPCANIPEGHDPAMWRRHNRCE